MKERMKKKTIQQEAARENSAEKKQKNRITGVSLRFILKLAWKEKPFIFLIYLLQLIAEVSRTMLMIIFPKYIVDEVVRVVDGTPFAEVKEPLLWNIGLMIGSYAVCTLIMSISNAVRQSVGEWFNRYLEEELTKRARTMDFEYTEDPAVLDRLNRAKEGINWYSGGVEGILSHFYTVVMNIVVLLGVVTIIVLGCPWLLLVQTASLFIASYFNYRNNKIEIQSFEELSALNRKFGYFFYELADFRLGKDIRLYDSSEMMGQKADRENKKMLQVWARRMRMSRRNSWGMDIANSLRDGCSYFYLGFLAVTGSIGVGDFTMYTGAAGRFFWALYNTIQGIQEIIKRCHYINTYIEFMKYPAAMEQGTESVHEGEHSIEVRDVSFRYPRGENYILRHINLTIHEGEHLSIVGLNGAGKTTFIKLLCRLYDVTEGEILIDGKNISEYSLEEYRKLLTVVFQDFQLFAFTLKENVVLDRQDAEEERINHALELSGIYDDAVKLENGLDTIIYKSFDEKGTELSGGQRQKLAISRALFRNAPIVILDEPTAALDPVAEYDIYRKFNELVGGKTALYISHRLSSCRFCDHIAVFDDCCIKEYGTHEELVKKEDGIYAKMFRAQAQYYVA